MKKEKIDVQFLCTYLAGIIIGLTLSLGRLLGSVKVQGLENFPHGKQRILVVSNHPYKGEHFLLIALFFPRYLLKPFLYAPWIMADMKNYFNKFPWRLFRSKLISVNRTGKLTGADSLELAYETMKRGGNIIMFPQGTRTSKIPKENLMRSPKKDKPMGPLKPGFARLATEVPGVMLVPVWSEINSWRNVRFTIGKSMSFANTSRKEVVDMTEKYLLQLADQTS